MSAWLIEYGIAQSQLTRQITSCRLASQQLYMANMGNKVRDSRSLTSWRTPGKACGLSTEATIAQQALAE